MARILSDDGNSFDSEWMLEGSRTGDFYLSTGKNILGLDALNVRQPFVGGGMNTATHATLVQIEKGTLQPAQAALRVRRPVILMGDDFRNDGDFTYLELKSDSKGFHLQLHAVGGANINDPAMHFSKPEAVATLTALYNAIGKDQKKVVPGWQKQLEQGRGYLAENLSRDHWDDAVAMRARYSEPHEQEAVDRLLFDKIRDTGVFLLKLGIPLPDDIRDDWMARFGTDPKIAPLVNRSPQK